MTYPEILLFIPQKPPFVMVDELLYADGTGTQTAFTVSAENALVVDGRFTDGGLMENMAQTAAAGLGYHNSIKNKVIGKGFIGSVKNFEVFDLPRVADKLITDVRIVEKVLNATIISGVVRSNGNLVAQCEMNVYIDQ
ncbi:putative hotdog family 3-hydroxylacyl-ACP dehydratase [Mucilaginibacter sp. UYP25]|uniref:3-hydroxyacyl-ACP dehydratase n=1 Tax=unclassified Mucilaginibacter TaxID=2617802 RepID=UPI003393D0FD